MVYQRESALEAWKAFVGSGEILEGKVRPEIARSWVRCRNAGVNPWSTDFSDPNAALLEEKQAKFAKSLRATIPIMKFLRTMLGCNVSLMDGENFVFELVSPMKSYPRTIGTFQREEEVGSGNATIVAYEKKPVRSDGFEHYRAIVQSYSGVSAPYLDPAGRYYGAMNINNPFALLPESALRLCVEGVELTNELFRAGDRMGTVLSTVEFFRPLMLAYEHPVLLMDCAGHILSANAGMRPFCPDWESMSYGSQSLDAFLAKDTSVSDILKLPEKLEAPIPILFKKGKSRSVRKMSLARHGQVDIEGQEPFIMLVFEDRTVAQETEKKVRRRQSSTGPEKDGAMEDYVGKAPSWVMVDNMVNKVAGVKTNVLLLGETGTGKEVVARALHRRSGRRGPFVAVNCGALPRDLLATELFGYEGGAFTGAREGGSVGKFEYAEGGTLFLDEIGEMPVDMQVSLLRVLQEQSVTRLGSNSSKPLNVRVIAATNQNINELINTKQFRSDLYYRLSLVEITLPPLRRRVEDVKNLVDYFNESLSTTLSVPCTPFPSETISSLEAYSWPGNVRELRNVVERSLIMKGEGAAVTPGDLPLHIANARNDLGMERLSTKAPIDLVESSIVGGNDAFVGKCEAESMRNAVISCDGDPEAIARTLGMPKDQLITKLQQCGVKVHLSIGDNQA